MHPAALREQFAILHDLNLWDLEEAGVITPGANGGSAPNYANVARGAAGASGFGHGDAGWPLDGTAGRHEAREHEDDFTQAGNLYLLMPADERERLVDNIAGAMAGVPATTQQRQLAHFDRADPGYGSGVRQALQARGALKA